METDDLSLVDINGVDDDLMSETSLVLKKDIKNPTPTAHIANLDLDDDDDENLIDFSCSPLQIDRSVKNPVYHSRLQPCRAGHFLGLKDKGEGSTTTAVSCSSPAMLNNNDKENLNDQNLSLRSPCEDPQETKRRKKRGGYNLRKSLAWNKAFFTEEGVLDASELSRLSKPSPRLLSSPMFLSSVAEEGSSSSFRKGAKVRGAGSNLNSVRGNLFSGSPSKPPLMKGRRVTSDSLSTTQSSAQKAASPIVRASRKVQLTKAPSGSVSPGGGCPRPSTLSSQRRLPNSNTLNRTVKDSKIPKPAILKAESPSLSTVSKNVAVGSKPPKLNRNLPPVTAEKSVGLRRGSLLIPEKKTNSASSSSRPYVIRSSKTSVNFSKDKHLSTDVRPPQSVKGTKIGLKTTPQPVLCAGNKHKAITESCTEVDNPAALNANCISEDIPNPQTQPTKVTGLRMPSPSLRFFDQPKSSASQSIQSVNDQLSNHRDSGIPIARKPSQSNCVVEPKPLSKLDGTARLSKGRTEIAKAEVKDLSSTSKCSVPPGASIDSYTKMKPDIEPRNVQVEANVSDSMSSFDQTSSQEESYNLNIDVDKQEVEESTRSHMPDEVGQIRHEVNLGSEPNHTSVCHTSPALVQRDSKLEKQVTATNKKHDEVESILHDVHMGMELSVNQLPLHAGSPEHFQMDNKLEKQETARNKKHDGVESILHDVHMGMEMSGNQLPPHAGSPEHFQMDNHPEKQEDAINNKNGEGDLIMHEVNLGSQLHNTSFVYHTSPVQVQSDDQLEKQEIAREQNHVAVEQIYHGVQMGLRKDNHLEKQEDGRDYIHDGVDQIMDEVNLGQQLSPSTGCPMSLEQEQKDSHTEKQKDARHHIKDEVDQDMHEVSLWPELNNSFLASLIFPEHNQTDNDLEKQEVAANHIHDEVAANHISEDVAMELELSDDDLSPLRTGYHGVSQGLEMSYVEKGQLKSLCTGISIDTCVTIPSVQLGDGDDNSVACTSALNVECVRVAHSVNGELGEVAELINQCQDSPEKNKKSEESQEIRHLGSISDVQTPEGLVMQLKESCIEKILQAKNSHFEPPSHPLDHCDISQNCCPEDVNRQAEEQLVLQESHHVLEMKSHTPLLDAEENLNVGKPCCREVKVDQVLEINDSTSFLNEEKSNSIKPLPTEVDADLQDGNPISVINDSTSPFNDEDQLNDRKYSSTEDDIDLCGGYHVLDMSDDASILESVSSEEIEKDNTLVLPTITRESIIYADLEITYPSGNMCQSLQVEERDAVDDVEHPHVEVTAFQCLESKSLAENHESPCDTPNKYPSEHNSPQVSVGLQSSLNISEDQTANSVATCVSTSNGFMDNDLKNCTSFEKTHTSPFGNSGTPNGELQSELKNGVLPQKSEASTMGSKRNSLEVPNKDALALKKLNAVPFSDEWLAALEAAGEDILTMKTGAVQNSPPDKSVPEPSPWSPVKRKHQEIGPFDCTKCVPISQQPQQTFLKLTHHHGSPH